LEVDGAGSRRGTQIFLPEQPLFIAIRQRYLNKQKEKEMNERKKRNK